MLSSPTATASALSLCAALCKGPTGSRAVAVFLAGDALQLIAQATQTHCSDPATASAEVLSACSSFASCLVEAVVAEDTTEAATSVSARLQGAAALVRRSVVSASSGAGSSVACMEAVLNLVIAATT